MLEVDLKHFPSKLLKAGSVALIGNGGNLAIALILHDTQVSFALHPTQYTSQQ